MINQPSKSTKLLGLDNYFNEFISLYNKKVLPNKILLSGKKGLGKSTLAYHVINYILSINEHNKYDQNNLTINSENRSYKLVNNNSHPNFHLIDLLNEKKNIDVSQVRDMITFTNKSSFDNMPKIILIDNIEYLNKSSNNSLLKIIEEPNENIFFILIHNNEKNILPTLKSRCLLFKISISFDNSVNISNKLLGKDISELFNQDIVNYYYTPGNFVRLIEFANEKKINLKEYALIDLLKLLIDKAYYKKNKFIRDILINFIELFFLKEYKQSNTKNLLLHTYNNFIAKIYNSEKFNLDEESLFLEFRSKLLNG